MNKFRNSYVVSSKLISLWFCIPTKNILVTKIETNILEKNKSANFGNNIENGIFILNVKVTFLFLNFNVCEAKLLLQ